MNKDEYIHSLENLLIFMCQTHESVQKNLLELAKQGNDAFFSVPAIQGTNNLIAISHIADMKFEQPKHGFRDVWEELQRKRS